MLPENSNEWCSGCSDDYNGWCAAGEIDIMEHINTETKFYGTLVSDELLLLPAE